MATKHAQKPKLSKGILEMKFMQRTKEKVTKENEVAEGCEMYSNEITERMRNSNSNFIIEPSFMYCEDLMEGRLSFRGMNPEIERLLELEKAEKDANKRHEQESEVSNAAMAKYYYSNMQQAGAGRTIEKKFSKLRKFNGQNKNNQKRSSSEAMPDNVAQSKKQKGQFIKPANSDEEADN